MKPYLILIAALVPISIGSAVFAQAMQKPDHRRNGPPPPPFLIVKALDSNSDGVISKEEIAKASESLATIDTNQDGNLTPDEYNSSTRHHHSHDELFARLMGCDKNKDSQISRQEVPMDLSGLFTTTDENKDGIVTTEELRRSKDAHRRSWQKQKGSSLGMANFIMRASDRNKDGKLSGDEIPDRLKGKLKMIDANKDGELDVAELEQLARFLMPHGGPSHHKDSSKYSPRSETVNERSPRD